MRLSVLKWVCGMLLAMAFTSSSQAIKRHRVAPAYNPKYAAIVVDADTGQVLESEDPDGRRHPASLAKMMNLYIIFDELHRGRLKLSTRMPVSAHASRQAPSKLGLQPGQTLTVGEAIQALVTKSANDAAVVVGEYLAGSEAAFARRMTQKAQALGMKQTTFKNASGLPNPLQITTARDMATLSRALYRDFPHNYTCFKQKQFIHKGVAHRNHNHLLGKVPGVDGIKTGFIGASGFNLAASAVRYDAAQMPHRLIVVVLGGPNRHWRDKRVSDLLETNFQRMGVSPGKSPWVETKYEVPVQPAAPAFKENNQGEQGQTGGGQTIDTTEIDVNQLLNDLSEEPEILTNATTTVKVTPIGWVQGGPEPISEPVKPVSGKKGTKQANKNVQVGTFSRQNDAQKAATDFQKIAGEGTVNIHNYSAKKGKKRFFTAQVNHLSSSGVEKACQKWRAQGNDCLIK